MSPITTIINAAHAPIVTVTVDKLSIVRHVPDQSRAYLKAQFLCLKDDEPAIFISGGSRAGYRVNIRGTLPGPTMVLFQGDPYNASLPFIRVELNPSKNASAGASPLSPYFEWMFDFGFAEFASKAKVTRLDIAIDIEGRGVADIRGALANSGALHSVLKMRIEAASQSAWWDPHHFWTLVPDCLVACGLLQGDKPAGSPPLKVGVLPANEQVPHGSQLPVS